jgi:hypothetical protein
VEPRWHDSANSFVSFFDDGAAARVVQVVRKKPSPRKSGNLVPGPAYAELGAKGPICRKNGESGGNFRDMW